MPDVFNFTYYYGNGDYYSGDGIADTGTYYAGQVIADGIINEVGLDGYYQIGTVVDAVSSGRSEPVGSVVVNSYFDADTNHGFSPYAFGSGSAGLTSESGYAYNSDYTYYDLFGNGFSEADLIPGNIGTYLYSFTYYYGNGDAYSGYGIADPAIGTQYYAGQVIADGIPDITGADGYYYISGVSDAVSSGYFDPAGSVVVNSYYDVETNSFASLIASISGSIYLGSNYLGSELGYASNFGGSITAPSQFGGNLAPYVSSEADLIAG